ncbi:unknown [Clostridium sp. CAG:273]|jgi:hypothetical protein|nr:hypothetical protein [Clostridia bacterium]CDE82650.1 unknown [Clostridium sp. CAG:273]
MYTTDPKIQEATVTVQTRPTDEYKHRRKVIITIPASFDFDDRNSTSAYYCAWNRGKNLPECSPYCAAIEAVKSSQNNIRLHELMLTSCKEKTFVSVIGETSDNINRIMQNLTQIFGDGIDFDTL